MCINKQDRGGQWVNAFSMAMPLALGRDEVERLTPGLKGQATPEHYFRPSPDSAEDPQRRPLQPTYHPACSGEHQLLRGETGKEKGGRGRERSSADRMWSSPKTPFTSIHPSHT